MLDAAKSLIDRALLESEDPQEDLCTFSLESCNDAPKVELEEDDD